MSVTIPEALHICPGCAELCDGPEYCARCREEIEAPANFHALRASQLYGALRRETGVMPESHRLSDAQWNALRKLIWRGIAVVGLAFWLLVAVDIIAK